MLDRAWADIGWRLRRGGTEAGLELDRHWAGLDRDFRAGHGDVGQRLDKDWAVAGQR